MASDCAPFPSPKPSSEASALGQHADLHTGVKAGDSVSPELSGEEWSQRSSLLLEDIEMNTEQESNQYQKKMFYVVLN